MLELTGADRRLGWFPAHAGDDLGRVVVELDVAVMRSMMLAAMSPLSACGAVITRARPGAANATPKDLVRIHVHGSSVRRDGHWVVPKELDVRVKGGGVTLDFTEAVITQPLLRITAEVRGGGLRLITRPGIVVEADDISLHGGGVELPEPPGPGVPVLLRVELSGSAHGAPRPPAIGA